MSGISNARIRALKDEHLQQVSDMAYNLREEVGDGLVELSKNIQTALDGVLAYAKGVDEACRAEIDKLSGRLEVEQISRLAVVKQAASWFAGLMAAVAAEALAILWLALR